ncbi:glycoside hydrolase family 16 protein [Aurantimonas sp. DM33-3]|uniref:glycoside hydrolase family 16 protein n=1 Tax=Aurantimonas sp. DM33-3 TaxID=2766955 RepID=UPI00165206BE|nr:glycoside hydrolase family 16 protein [Aurantimonas sp. DM33-3]MBC6715564.1 glycoside hydrolase family 16 protein [Aurantimonas sp. DM33-3]
MNAIQKRMQKAIASIRISGSAIVSLPVRWRFANGLNEGSKRAETGFRVKDLGEFSLIVTTSIATAPSEIMMTPSPYRRFKTVAAAMIRSGAAGLARSAPLVSRKTCSLVPTSATLAIATSLALLASAPHASSKEASIDIDRYALRFSAEFDNQRDLSDKFINHYRRWGNLRTLAGNEEQQLYVDRTYLDAIDLREIDAPFEVKGGNLEIIARPTPKAARDRIDFPYISGLVTTEETFAQTYGYFEIRCRMQAGQGMWPAFWLVGMTHDEALEIDVFEMLGHEPRRIYHSIHTSARGVEWGAESDRVDPTADFNTYGVDWQEKYIDFYVNRERVARAEAVLPGPMYMIANLAVGGNWGGNPDETTKFPARLVIDYIRAYERIDP